MLRRIRDQIHHETRPNSGSTPQLQKLPSFTYDPLEPKFIRTLVPDLFPNPEGRTWRLETISLDAPNVEFKALSHVWGSQAESFPMTLNGCLAHVHRNLYIALLHLARCGDVKPVWPIWIDAICINQEDQEEKMAQIQLMNKIYRKANTVWAWLGVAEHQDRIPEAIQFIDRVADENDSAEFGKVPFNIAHVAYQTGRPMYRDLALLSAVLHLINNDWFRRVWIVQEAALARNLCFLCGEHEINQLVMKDAACNAGSVIELYGAHGVSLGQGGLAQAQTLFYICSLVKHCWYEKRTTPDLLPQMLSYVTTCMADSKDCLQPRDHILGIMGMFDLADLENTGMDPHLPYRGVQDLYTRFTTLVLTGYDPTKKTWWDWLSLFVRTAKNRGATILGTRFPSPEFAVYVPTIPEYTANLGTAPG
jgi:hypothetical protein